MIKVELIKVHMIYYLETINKKGKYIIDYTKNVIMPKEEYVKLTCFEEIERISDMEYLQHIQKIKNFGNISIKAYTTFGKELVEELEKNSFMFEEDKELEKKLDEIRKFKLKSRKKLLNQRNLDEEERE